MSPPRTKIPCNASKLGLDTGSGRSGGITEKEGKGGRVTVTQTETAKESKEWRKRKKMQATQHRSVKGGKGIPREGKAPME